MTEILIFSASLILTVVGVAVFRRFGGHKRLLDVPNERSSHAKPTLRGGGIVIVAVCITLYFAAAKAVSMPLSWSYFAGAMIVAGVSWVDDILSLPAWTRLFFHGLAAVIIVTGLGGLDSFYIPVYGSLIDLGVFGPVLSVLWIVWMINAYNFMDGIDGLAGAQGIAAGLGWAAFGFIAGTEGLYLFGGVIAFSCLGFLVHNWPPAKIFMGDVGSAFLGFTFAALPFLMADQLNDSDSGWIFFAAVSFVWLFLFDTIYTFSRRLVKREKVWDAHRQHLYQRMVISGAGHGTVSLIYGTLALCIAGLLAVAYILRGKFEVFLLLFGVLTAAVIAIAGHRKKG